MKKKLSQMFLRWAKKLDPKGKVENVEEVTDYEASKIGLNIIITKKDIKRYKAENNVSQREAIRLLVQDSKKQIKQHVMDVIQRQQLIENEVGKIGDNYQVTGELKVYVKK